MLRYKRVKSKNNKSKRRISRKTKSRKTKSRFQMKRKKQDDDISSLLQNMSLNDSENSHQSRDLLERANLLKHEKLQSIQLPSSNQRTFARRSSSNQRPIVRGVSTFQELEEKRLEQQLEDQIDYLTNKLNNIRMKRMFQGGRKNLPKQTEEEKRTEYQLIMKDWEEAKQDQLWDDAFKDI
jgi:hypothetical protein